MTGLGHKVSLEKGQENKEDLSMDLSTDLS